MDPLSRRTRRTRWGRAFQRLLALATMAMVAPRSTAANEPRVAIAAAANLVYALDALNTEFKRTAPEVRLTTTTAASGSLFAQIRNGAPFDVFLSADTEYPQQVVAAGLGEATTLRTFATGRLVLWTTRRDFDLADVTNAVRSSRAKKIAIAQPKSAPYGRAALAVLEKLGVLSDVQPKLVFGENISQTAQFVQTGSADVGFVALSFVRSPRLTALGRWQEIPAEWHAGVSLDHAAVLTKRGGANPAARRYLDFLGTEAARKILRNHGYGVPQ